MESFLKEPITGIILLGAIGSILAAITLWGLNKIVKIFAPTFHKFVVSTVAHISVFLISPGLQSQVKLYLHDNPNKLNAYYSTQKSKIVIILSLSTWVLVWLLFRVKLDGIELYSFEAIFYVSLFFLLFGFAIRSQLSIMVPLIVDIDTIIEDNIKKLDPETLKKYREYKANKALQRTSR